MPDLSNVSAWVALIGLVVIWAIDKLLATLRNRGADLPLMAQRIKDLHDAENKRQERQELISMLKEKEINEQDH